LLAELEATALAQHLRASVWTYPLVNAAHIAGLALLFGGIVPVDLRLLGVWRSVPLEALLRTARVVSFFGLILAVAMGILLFAVSATEFAGKLAFQIKLVLIVLALLNAGFAGRALRGEPRKKGRLRLHAGLSIGLWLSVILAGRAIAYF
jgi:hypothetical protein